MTWDRLDEYIAATAHLPPPKPFVVQPRFPCKTFRRLQRRFLTRLREQQRERQRSQIWNRLTGLPPPEHRGFVPRRDDDERPAKLDKKGDAEMDRMAKVWRNFRWGDRQSDDKEGYPRRPKTGIPAVPDDAPPSWDNVVRAYEEDR